MKHIFIISCMLFAVLRLSAQQNKIVEYEYWLDNNDVAKTSQAVSSPAKTFLWQTTIPYDNLTEGIHTLNVKFKDANGLWSPTVSRYFYKLPIPIVTSNTVVAYEYWIDDEARVAQTISPTAQYNFLQNLADDKLSEGLHSVNIRFKDVQGKWSSTVSRYFYKKPIPAPIDNRLVAYEYWINDLYDNKFSGSIDNEKSFVILDSLDVRKAVKATNYIFFRFKDVMGNWSSVLSQDFYRPVEPAFTSIVGLSDVTFNNTTKYADKYEWDFGDGTATSDQVNPIHTYSEPGAYQVKLIASNKAFTDSMLHYVEIDGIRAINSNKGGNSGYVTVNIYGGGLGDATQVKLQKGSVTIIADSIKLIQEGILWVKFNLVGKECGIYNVIVETKSGIKTLVNGFTIENYISEPISADVIGKSSFINGRPQEITIQIRNNSNVDMEDVPIVIETEGNPTFQDKNGNILVEPQPFIPLLPAGNSLEIKYKITANGNFTMNVIPQNIPLNASSTDCLLTLGKAGFDALEGDILDITPPPYACAYLIIKSQIVTVKENIDNMWDPWYSHLWNWAANTIDAGKDCGYAFLDKLTPSKWIKYAKFAQTIESRYNDAVTAYGIYKDCFSSWNLNPTANPFAANIVVSFDPNEILGVSGYGDKNYIAKRNSLNYTLYFENDAEKATAPAQEIFLTDTLDLTKFDSEQFSFGTFTFRDITVEAIPGVTEFSKDIDMRPKGENIIVRISAVFDKAKGIINWHLIALDPETMDLTESPYLGVLYPNTTPPIGEGNVTYSIGLLNNVGDGAVIKNQGHIAFDLNEPIATNVYVNTIDISIPTSRMNSTYQIENDSIIDVSWSGTDTGSGIANYTVYVSENNGDYYVWLSQTSETSGKFEGQRGNIYKFFVVAADNAGNSEKMKTDAELTVSIDNTAIKQVANDKVSLKVIPNPVESKAIIEFYLQRPENVSLAIYNSAGQKVKELYNGQAKAGINQIPFDSSKMSAGVYFITLQSIDSKETIKVVIR